MKKIYAREATEQRPDTSLIEAKLRQYFKITEQKYNPQAAANHMYVAMDALAALARNPKEHKRTLQQFQELTEMTVVIANTKGEIYITHPFEIGDSVTDTDGSILAVEMGWSNYETMSMHKTLTHPNPDTEFIKRMHDTLMHSFEDQLTEHIERLKNKFNQ